MIALIDGDIAVYRVGFASNTVSEGFCRARMDEFLTDLLMFQLDCEDVEGFLTWDSQSNYRVKLAVTQPYKGNRKAPKPVHYDFLRHYLVDEWGFQQVMGQEADDSMAQWATKFRDQSIICTIDKDLDQVPGWHYNFVKHRKYYVTDDAGFHSFCLQLLTGDRADNITGIRGCGPVGAAKLLESTSGYLAQLKKVSERYREEDGGSLSRFRENCSLLWLRRNSDQEPELIDYLLKEIK
jgi:hypothetical protein